MIRYESTPQQVLPKALSFLYAHYDALLCPGTSLAIMPDLTIHHTRSQQGSPDYGRGFYDKIRAGDMNIFETRVPPPQGSGQYYLSASLVITHLPFGLPIIHRKTIDPFTTSFLPCDTPTSEASSSADCVDVPEPLPSHTDISRKCVGRYDLTGFVEEIVDPIWEDENEFCLKELSGLPRHEGALEYRDDMGLGDLLEHIRIMANPDPDSPVKLDTVFMPGELFSKSAPDEHHVNTAMVKSSAPGCPSMFGMGHRLVPENTLYVISSACGPRFINGPTTITCTESNFGVLRYSSVVSPPADDPAVPYGFKIDIKAVS